MAEEVALFPLGTVLYPGGPLALRIFEPRYLDMTSACLRDERPFGVCLIRSGHEVGEPAVAHPVGTLARIVDWHQNDDGILGLTAHGEGRLRTVSTRVMGDGLVVGTIERLPEEPARALPEPYQSLVPLVTTLMERTGALYADVPRAPDDATWVGYRLAEILPLPMEQKQHLLEVEDPILRLELVAEFVRSIRGEPG